MNTLQSEDRFQMQEVGSSKEHMNAPPVSSSQSALIGQFSKARAGTTRHDLATLLQTFFATIAMMWTFVRVVTVKL